jgi:AcrR family transcriptional regulator
VNAFTKLSRSDLPPKSRVVQKGETRERILRAAREHFEARGFDGASVRAIAQGAGVAAGTVLLHFTDKRDLLHAALFADLEALIDAEVARTADAPLAEALGSIARRFFAYYAERPALSKTLLREALLAEPPWRDRFTGQVTRVHAHVAGLAVAAKRRGEIAEQADPMLLGVTFFAFYYFALIGWVQGGFADPAPLFERLLSEHLRGLAPQPSRRTKR